MVTHQQTMSAIRAGMTLLAIGAVAGFPRTVPTGPTARRYGPFHNKYAPWYARGTHDPGTETDPAAAINGAHVLVDQSSFNFTSDEDDNDDLQTKIAKKLQRALAIGAFLKRYGAQSIGFILDPQYRDRDAPKDDIRKKGTGARSQRGVASHYKMNGPHQKRHRDRGAEYKAIADALKKGLENAGFTVIQAVEGGAEVEI